MRGDASVCPHCQRESQPWIQQNGIWLRRDESGNWEFRYASGDGVSRWMKAPDGMVVDESAATRES
jgi:hypothetical protein